MPETTSRSYVIWRTYGAGFWSIVASTLAHCDIATKGGMVPVIDLQNYPTVYQESRAIGGTRNVWEYYFAQPSGRNLAEVGEIPHVIDGTIPPGYPREIGDQTYRKLWRTHVQINEPIAKRISHTVEELAISQTTLGVHFRGQEMRTAIGHKFPPTLNQMNDAITHTLENSNFDKILLVTEAQQYVEYFQKKWGSRIVPSPTFRVRHRNSYNLKPAPRENHRFQLGFEALQDAHLLSECGGLIRGHSGLSEAALLIAKAPFRPHVRISQGRNSFRPYVAPWMWYLKAIAPSALGGFRKWRPTE